MRSWIVGAILVVLILPAVGRAEPTGWAYYMEARREANCGHYRTALALVEDGLEVAPKMGQLLLLRGRLLSMRNRDIPAIESLERARRYGDAATRQNADWELQELGVDHRSTPIYAEE